MQLANLKVLLNGSPVGDNILKDGEILCVGRIGGSNDVELDDPKVSRNHARISMEGGKVVITDLGSRNSTLVNGAPIPANSPHALNHGDTVKFSNNGKFEMLVTMEGFAGGGADAIPETKRGFHYQGGRDDLKQTEIGGEDDYGKTQIGKEDERKSPGKKPGKSNSPGFNMPRIPGVNQPRMPNISVPGVQSPRIPGMGRPIMPNVNVPRSPGAMINAASDLMGGSDEPDSEQAIDREYAGFWLRFVAAFLDGLILGITTGIPGSIIIFIVGGIATITSTFSVSEGSKAGLIVLLVLLFFLLFIIVPWLYYSFFESSSKQATPGKMIIGLQVTDMNGEKISFLRATGRHFGKVLSYLTFYVGYIMAGFTQKKQGLHDIIAKTLVLKK